MSLVFFPPCVNAAAAVLISLADLQDLYNRVSQSLPKPEITLQDEILCTCHSA